MSDYSLTNHWSSFESCHQIFIKEENLVKYDAYSNAHPKHILQEICCRECNLLTFCCCSGFDTNQSLDFQNLKFHNSFLIWGSPKFSKCATIVSRRMQLGIKIASISFLLPLYMASNIILHQVSNMLYYFCLFNNICFFLLR